MCLLRFFLLLLTMSDTELLEQLLDKKLQPIMSSIEGFRSTVSDLVKSTSFLSEQFEVMRKQIESLQNENKSISEENSSLKIKVTEMRQALDTMELTLDNMEQYSRRDCLEIKGVPIQDGEDTDGIVKSIGESIGVQLEESDISVSHRLAQIKPSRTSMRKDPSIIVKFVRRNTRDEFYKARKLLRGKTTKDLGLSRVEENNLFISESLTKKNKDLFHKCLRARRALEYSYIWTQAGKIFLRKDQRSAAKLITSERALEKLYVCEGEEVPPDLAPVSSYPWRARHSTFNWVSFNAMQQEDK